jgi:putative intracellular protease/amidase
LPVGPPTIIENRLEGARTEGSLVVVLYPGSHGPMWDLANDPTSIALIEKVYEAGEPVAAACHAPAVLHLATYRAQPIVKG